MLDPLIIDDLIAKYTAHEMRERLDHDDLNRLWREHFTAAIYYSEVTDNV